MHCHSSTGQMAAFLPASGRDTEGKARWSGVRGGGVPRGQMGHVQPLVCLGRAWPLSLWPFLTPVLGGDWLWSPSVWETLAEAA